MADGNVIGSAEFELRATKAKLLQDLDAGKAEVSAAVADIEKTIGKASGSAAAIGAKASAYTATRIKLENDLQVAQALGDKARINAISNEIVLLTTVERLKKAGVSATDAQAVAEAHLLALIAARAKVEGAAVHRSGVGQALTDVFDSARLATIEEAGTKVRVFGTAIEALGPEGIAAAAALVALFAVFEEAKKAAEFAEDIKAMSTTLGISTTKLQEFDFVAVKSNIAVGSFRDTLKAGNDALGAFQSNVGDQRLKDAFKAIGITKDQARSIDNITQILPQIADKIKALKSTAEQAKLAEALGLGPLLPVLLKGGDSFAVLAAEAHKYGVVVDSDVINRSAEAAEKLRVASDVIDKNLKSAFADLSPVIADATAKLAEFVHALTHAFGGAEVDKNLDAMFQKTQQILKTRADIRSARSGTVLGGLASGMAGITAISPDQREFQAQHLERQLAAQEAELKTLQDAVNKGLDDQNASTKPKSTKAPGLVPDRTAEAAAQKAAEQQKKYDEDLAAAQKAILAARDNEQASAVERAAIAKQILEDEIKARAKALDDQVKTKEINPTGDQLQALKDANTARADAERKALDAKQAQELRVIQLKADKDLADALIDSLSAQREIATTAAARAALDAQILSAQQAGARSQKVEELRDDPNKSQDAKDAELAAFDAAASAKARKQSLDAAQAIQDELNTSAEQGLQAQIDTLSAQTGLAKSIAARRDGELRLLDLQDQLEKLKLQEIIDSKATSVTDAQRADAQAKIAEIDKTRPDRQAAVVRANQAPLASFRDQINRDANQLNEDYQGVAVDGLKAVNDQLLDAIMNSHNLGQAFENVANSIISDLLRIAIQQEVVKPLAGALFGDGGSGSGLLGGLFGPGFTLNSGSGGLGGIGGGRASGGSVMAGQTYRVGELGPEYLTMGADGYITPNRTASRGGQAPAAPVTVHIQTSIDARGATQDAAQALMLRFDKMERELPGKIVSTVNDGLERRYIGKKR